MRTKKRRTEVQIVTVPSELVIIVSIYGYVEAMSELEYLNTMKDARAFAHISLHHPVSLSLTASNKLKASVHSPWFWWISSFARAITEEENNAYKYILKIGKGRYQQPGHGAVFTKQVARIFNKVNLTDDDGHRVMVYTGGEQE